MIRGITATVYKPKEAAKDRLGNTTKTWESVKVDNVLVSPLSGEDLETSRPEGVNVALTLHFPKSFTASLKGCEVALPAPWALAHGRYRVIGDPMPYIDANVPNAWNRPVNVEAVHG